METQLAHFKVVRFMTEAGLKLSMKSVSMATAAVIYHKFFQICSLDKYDPYSIGTTALYLAGKVEEENLKLRDVINVSYRTIHSDKQPLEIGSTYWALRDSIAQCELFVLRMLKFELNFIHPHKYLLHFMKSLNDWLEPDTVKNIPISRTAWAILRDSYHGNLCLDYKPHHIAVAVLYLSLQCYGVEVPTNHQAKNRWWEALCADISLDVIRKIIRDILEVYELESSHITQTSPASAEKGPHATT